MVAQEIGKEQAVSLMAGMFENMGKIRGKMIKEQTSSKKFDAKAAWSQIKVLKDTIGEHYEVSEESPQRVVARIGRCPFYEAALMLGTNPSTIETGCRAGAARLADATLKQLNPNLSFMIRKFRSIPDDFCEEEIILC
jgi:L-2-amino-thiazoline-4-carboxylic acid hydrolase